MEMLNQINELKFLLPIMNKGHEIVMEFLDLEVINDNDVIKAIEKLKLLKEIVLIFEHSLQDKKSSCTELVMNDLNEKRATIIRVSQLNSIF